MPLPPLPEPSSGRLSGLARAVPITLFLLPTLLAVNVAQTASLVLLPFSRRAFRTFNRWAANTWWGWCVIAAERLNGVRSIVSGDAVPMRENAIVIVNHQQMSDIPLLMALARTKDRLGDLKWFVKHPVKYVPGIGWGMWFIDCVFLRRNWTQDRASIERTFSAIVNERIALWLVSFVEGTRLTPEKLARSQDFAREHGLDPTRHVLLPRTKGFVASVQGLRGHVDAIYDVTIGYVRGVPTLWQYVKGRARIAHLHVRRYAVEDLPETGEALAAWLLERFHEKDRLLEWYYERGHFPRCPLPAEVQAAAATRT